MIEVNSETQQYNMKTLMIIIFSMITISCATQKQQTKNTPDFDQIKFGSGGGFTGAERQYLLENNGNVYKVTRDSTFQINQIAMPEIDSISNLLDKISFKSIEFNETGNFTYHIEVITSDYKKKVTWTDQSQAVELKNIYNKLVKTLK